MCAISARALVDFHCGESVYETRGRCRGLHPGLHREKEWDEDLGAGALHLDIVGADLLSRRIFKLPHDSLSHSAICLSPSLVRSFTGTSGSLAPLRQLVRSHVLSPSLGHTAEHVRVLRFLTSYPSAPARGPQAHSHTHPLPSPSHSTPSRPFTHSLPGRLTPTPSSPTHSPLRHAQTIHSLTCQPEAQVHGLECARVHVGSALMADRG